MISQTYLLFWGLRKSENFLFTEKDLSDISDICQLENLEILDIRRTSISDISSISECKKLKRIHFWDTNVVNTSPLLFCPELKLVDPNFNSEDEDNTTYLLKERFPDLEVVYSFTELKKRTRFIKVCVDEEKQELTNEVSPIIV
jgi:Leucine-rich repeat (LRR) protein